MLGLGGEREVIGLQVAPAETKDPEEKPEVCHLTSSSPSEDSSYFFNANDLRAFNRICIAAYIYY